MYKHAFVAAVVFAAGHATAQTTLTFDTTVPTASSQAPDVWYTDRYAPAVFESAFFDGDNRLHQGVRDADTEANRPSNYSGTFYNYQGRKLDIGSGYGHAVSIDLYVDSAWNSGVRAGMWTTMSNGNLSYPILEYVVNGDNDDGNGATFTGFRWWQSGIGWTATSLVAPTADAWYNLEVELTTTDVNYYINGSLVATTDNLGAHMIDNVILQAHNQGVAGEYDVYWDNFTYVPTPASAALLGLAGLAATRRRR
ncbi:MAG: hypothetical protein R3B49_01255 [Phycisphaerales bacterium]